jgi:hypothetical protein
MRLYTRIIFGLNFLYQVIVGAIFLVSPVISISLYGFAPADAQSIAAHVGIRMMGVFLLLMAVVSVMIAINPDKNPVLLPLMGLASVLTLLCWALTLLTGEMKLGQVGLDIIVQVLLLIAVAGYAGKAGKAAKA